MKYLKYFWYVIRHKWFVFYECTRLGITWLGLIHDWSKFRPSEFIPYARHFYGSGGDIKKGRDETGYYKPTDTGDAAFDFAWLLHQKRNRHHWQWWVLPQDKGGGLYTKRLRMPDKYVLEMFADWCGAGRAQGTPNVKAWYEKHKDKLQLHPISRSLVEALLVWHNGRRLRGERW